MLKTENEGIVAIFAFSCFFTNDRAGTDFDDGHGNAVTGRCKNLGHSNFAAINCFCHFFSSRDRHPFFRAAIPIAGFFPAFCLYPGSTTPPKAARFYALVFRKSSIFGLLFRMITLKRLGTLENRNHIQGHFSAFRRAAVFKKNPLTRTKVFHSGNLYR